MNHKQLTNAQMNQNCAETMLIKAALLIGKKVQFDYKNPIEDIQVDISPAFMFSRDEEKMVQRNESNFIGK